MLNAVVGFAIAKVDDVVFVSFGVRDTMNEVSYV